MKTGFNKIWLAITLLTFTVPAFAIGSIIAFAILGVETGWAFYVLSFAINMVASTIISRVFAPDMPTFDSTRYPDPGNRQQVPPATNNKLPIVYGSSYVGGTIVDLSITNDNQSIYYVMALSEVTNSENGNTGDVFSFGDVYWGGKKCVFKNNGDIYNQLGIVVEVGSNYVGFYNSNSSKPSVGQTISFNNPGNLATHFTVASVTNHTYSIVRPFGSDSISGFRVTLTTPISGGVAKNSRMYSYSFNTNYGVDVIGLYDESTGLTDNSINGFLQIYLYRDGSNNPTNSPYSAIQVMQNPNLTYQWDSNKLMTNCAFAIIKLNYSRDANVTGLNQTRFQVINPRSATGDCFLDYLTSERYGAALPLTSINTDSLDALTAYSSQTIDYTPYTGGTGVITRFRFDGVLDTNVTIMSNMQMMANCCDCLIKYNEITAQWGVIVQTPEYDVSLAINDSNLIGALTISPLDTSNTFNIAEVKFVDGALQDTFASAIFDLAEINPSLLYPNEPVNKQVITLPLVNSDIRAQLLANRFLESCRQDLQVQCSINFVGIQLEAGDIVTITNTNYGWAEKLFRVQKITENFADDGSVTASLLLSEFIPTVYDDANVTQFTPAPNTGLPDVNYFGTIYPPNIDNIVNSGYKPKFDVIPYTSSDGIIEYLELWYSTAPNPTIDQVTLLTTYTSINGVGYGQSLELDPFEIATFEAGTYYFFVRVGNSFKTSAFSSASEIIWNPNFIDDVVIATANGVNITWTPVENWRLAGYKIRYQYGADTDWGTAAPLANGILTDTSFAATGLSALQVSVLIKAVDTVGHESQNAAVVQLNTSDTLVANVIDTIDFKAGGWLGDKVNCHISGGNLVADLQTSFYGSDDQSFYALDADSFYDADTSKALMYTTEQTYINSALAGSVGVLYWTAEGNSPNIEYRQIYATPFYGADGDSKYGIDDNASFYGEDSPFLPMPSSIVVQNGYYQFRISLQSGTIGEVSQFEFAIDAPDIVEVVSNHIVTGGVIPYTKDFTVITAIQATLQQNALGVVTLRVDKTNPLAPTITGYNSSQIATSGAKADITLQGY